MGDEEEAGNDDVVDVGAENDDEDDSDFEDLSDDELLKPPIAKPTSAKPTAAKPTAAKPTSAKPTAAKLNSPGPSRKSVQGASKPKVAPKRKNSVSSADIMNMSYFLSYFFVL